MPQWMWVRIGEPHGDDCWVGLTHRPLSAAAAITLRPHRHAVLQEAVDPLALLTSQLTRWASVSVGATLPLPCGDFDIMGVEGEDGAEIGAGCILDRDVRLELVPAVDYVAPRPPTPIPPEPVAVSAPTLNRWGRDPTLPRGFIPFSGMGRRLDS